MKHIKKSDVPALIEGSLFYGTGGGGDPIMAKTIWDRLAAKKRLPFLATLNEFSKGICITAFPVGGLKAQSISSNTIRKALDTLQKKLSSPVVGVIPVEIGALSLALAAEVAAELSLPLVDADFVGGRSTPEVFLETITLFGIPRTPLVVVNRRGDVASLEESSSSVAEEEFLRTFSTITEGFSYVFGYPIKIPQAKRTLTENTVSQAQKVGKFINSGFLRKEITRLGGNILCNGTITAIETIDKPGFNAQNIDIQTRNGKGRVFVKNENMIFWMNNQPVLSCPDLIILLDERYRPLFNQIVQVGKKVTVIGMPAAPLWRTKIGRELFCPKLFGYPFPPALLNTI